MKIMGLDSCADTMVGDAMRRGLSGGEQKRLTTAEMIVGPSKALFLDEISTGLDSSSTYQIVSCLQQLAHTTESSVVVSLLQPASETYDLFDDVILMAEGKTVYHGPRRNILDFFKGCGFTCPERKSIADFLQEVLSRKDQEQYWSYWHEQYAYMTVDQFVEKFTSSQIGQKLINELSMPLESSEGLKNALSFTKYSLSNFELFKACLSRELLLMRRNSLVYIVKSTQLALIAIIAGTVFLRTRMGVDTVHASYYMGALFYALILTLVNGFPELIIVLSRMQVFNKQRDYNFYPSWAYAIPAAPLKIPISLAESLTWTCITYFLIGYSPEALR
ncbi:ABC transporter G family member 41 [Rhynchospora pubera]|uniref:ABC transporter G family member 41 n=1 Tax=Rhynchospora pubera TaxID=906938 RepID=A0AAV8HMR8_9POAL|nr:ABC transporter G family member 41 [Rhynchospora pubera]